MSCLVRPGSCLAGRDATVSPAETTAVLRSGGHDATGPSWLSCTAAGTGAAGAAGAVGAGAAGERLLELIPTLSVRASLTRARVRALPQLATEWWVGFPVAQAVVPCLLAVTGVVVQQKTPNGFSGLALTSLALLGSRQ